MLDRRGRAQIVRESYQHFARTMLDFFWSPRLTSQNFSRYVEFENRERWKVDPDPFGLSDSSAEKREDFSWDLFSLHRHFAEPTGAIFLFRFRQRGAADNDPRFILRCLR